MCLWSIEVTVAAAAALPPPVRPQHLDNITTTGLVPPSAVIGRPPRCLECLLVHCRAESAVSCPEAGPVCKLVGVGGAKVLLPGKNKTQLKNTRCSDTRHPWPTLCCLHLPFKGNPSPSPYSHVCMLELPSCGVTGGPGLAGSRRSSRLKTHVYTTGGCAIVALQVLDFLPLSLCFTGVRAPPQWEPRLTFHRPSVCRHTYVHAATSVC